MTTLSLADLRNSADFVMSSDKVWVTPMISHAEDSLRSLVDGSKLDCSVFLKLESAQNGGSYKMRGVFNQIAHLPPSVDNIFTISGRHACVFTDSECFRNFSVRAGFNSESIVVKKSTLL